jgi:uncharacterized protein (TIGR03086 family)
MDGSALVDSAHAAFLARLDLVTAASLDEPTPCEGWDVASLLRHVVGGCRMTLALLDGADTGSVGPSFESAASLEGHELISSCRQSVLEQGEALRELPDPEAIVHFPLGDMSASKLRSFRIVEMTIHAWDLARSLEADDALPSDVVAFSIEGIELMAGELPSGMFGTGPTGDLGEGAGEQDRLLDLSGRRP